MPCAFQELEAGAAERRQAREEPPEFEWKHYAPQHFFIGYRVAQFQNAARVALEAGNSTQMISDTAASRRIWWTRRSGSAFGQRRHEGSVWRAADRSGFPVPPEDHLCQLALSKAG